MKTILTCLVASAIGLFILAGFSIHDIICQKKLKPIVEREKAKKLKELKQSQKKGKKTDVKNVKVQISIHDKDIKQEYYTLVCGALLGYCVAIFGVVIYNLIAGVWF